jgi:hypothetical protein
MPPARLASWILAGLGTLAAPMHAENVAKKVLLGDTKVDVVAKYQGEPLPKPDKALVDDFNVPADVISVDSSPAARVHRKRSAAQAASSPEAVARQVQASFSKALLRELQRASVPAQAAAAGAADAPAPPHALLVQGEFTKIDQGNKTKRVFIGFGKGASDVQAHVKVSLATEQQPEPIVLLEFNVKSQSGKKPGAAVTVGAGAATMGTVSAPSAAAGVATGGITDTAATVEADASRMAKGVAKQIADLMASQTWASPQATPQPN